jgi:hypothetical protein
MKKKERRRKREKAGRCAPGSLCKMPDSFFPVVRDVKT